MKIRKRLFKHSDNTMKEALKSFADFHKINQIFKKDVLKGESTDDQGQTVSNVYDITSRIEDFANIIYNNGFDVETQKHLTIAELSAQMEDFIHQEDGIITKDFSTSTLGFLVQQTVTRLVSQMEEPELEAWMFVSRELILKEGSVIYNVVVGKDGHGTTRIAEGGEYNTISLESAENYIKTAGWKVGVKVKYSEEAKERIGIAGIKMLTEAAIADIKRYKSVEALRLLEANAKTYFDGLDPEKMPSGVSRTNLTLKNGTLLMRDLRDFFASTQTEGYDVDIMFLHPLAYDIFMYEKSVKEYFKQNANVYFLLPKKKQTIGHNMFTKLKSVTSGTLKAAEGVEPLNPPLIQNKTYTIIVTPFLSFHVKGQPIYKPETRYTAKPVQAHASAPNNCSDILLVDSSRALSYVHNGKGIISDTVQNKLVDTEEIKFKTYYQFVVDNDHGIFAFRNINMTRDVVDIDAMPEVITYTKADVIAEE